MKIITTVRCVDKHDVFIRRLTERRLPQTKHKIIIPVISPKIFINTAEGLHGSRRWVNSGLSVLKEKS